MPVFEKREKPWSYGFHPSWFVRNCVTIPIVPSVAMKAKASGIPAKFAATPEKRRERRAQEPRRSVPDHRVRDHEAEEASDERRNEAHLDAVAVGAAVRLVEERAEVVERPAAFLVLERADEHLPRRQEQEERDVEEERDDSEPRQGEAPAGFRRPERLLDLSRGGQQLADLRRPLCGDLGPRASSAVPRLRTSPLRTVPPAEARSAGSSGSPSASPCR